MALSAMIKQVIPTTPLEGVHCASDSRTTVVDLGWKSAVAVTEFIVCALNLQIAMGVFPLSSFVFPIGISRVFDVPKWSATFDCWDLSEIILWRRRTSAPFQGPGVPRIVACGPAFAQ